MHDRPTTLACWMLPEVKTKVIETTSYHPLYHSLTDSLPGDRRCLHMTANRSLPLIPWFILTSPCLPFRCCRSDSRNGRVAPLLDEETKRANTLTGGTAAEAAAAVPAEAKAYSIAKDPAPRLLIRLQADESQAPIDNLLPRGDVRDGTTNGCDATLLMQSSVVKADASLSDSRPHSHTPLQPASQATCSGSDKPIGVAACLPSTLYSLLASTLSWLLLAGDFDFLSAPGSPHPPPLTSAGSAPLPPPLLLLTPSSHPSPSRSFRLLLSALRGLLFAALTAVPLWPLAVLPPAIIWGADEDISRWPWPQVYKAVLGGCAGALLTPVVAVVALLEAGRVRGKGGVGEEGGEREASDGEHHLAHDPAVGGEREARESV